MPITSQLVKDFHIAASKKYGAEFITKPDSDFMKLIGAFLDGIGVMDKENFMKNFVTTIGTKIYIPYEIGVADKWDLWEQLSVTVHEMVHVEQFRDAPAEFMLKYLLYKSDRATYEAQVYAADLEMAYWKTGQGYDLAYRTKSLLSYGLQQEHVDYVVEYLKIHDDVLKQGGGASPVAAWAKEWLTVNGAR